MPTTLRTARLAAILALTLIAPAISLADDPAPKSEPRKAEEAIKPLPPVAIPDDPPPHEGAMIDIPYVIEPPDIIVVELLEALPGRPITGERLVKPDGTISLGFYGDLHVRGLTIQQVKLKVIHHMREFVIDDVLDLKHLTIDKRKVLPLPKPGTVVPNEEISPRSPADPPPAKPRDEPPVPEEVDTDPKPPTAAPPRLSRGSRGSLRSRSFDGPVECAEGCESTSPPRESLLGNTTEHERMLSRFFVNTTEFERLRAQPEEQPLEVQRDQDFKVVYRDPAESRRVFVDVTSFNSKVYFVQGDVGVPGRLPFTGKETILDALNYAGGLIPTAEPKDIHLYRPAQGGKPARDYAIDLEAIHKGDVKANLQIFQGDRLIVGRNATVKKTVDLDRAAAPINSVMNTILQYTFTARSLSALGAPVSGNTEIKVNGQTLPLPGGGTPPMTAAQRDADFKAWFEFLWDLSSREGGKLLDEKALRDAVMKKLSQPSTGEPVKR